VNMLIERDDLATKLREADYSITFTKVDGTERIMKCTLRPLALPEQQGDSEPTSKNANTLAVWDLDKSAWRSFRLDSVKSIIPL